MMKTNTGAAKPRLSELLHRRGQTVEAFAHEMGIKTDDLLSMHCVMHGINKDMTLPAPPAPKPVAEHKVEKTQPLAKPKKPSTKNALVDLTTLVHAGTSATVSESDTPDEG